MRFSLAFSTFSSFSRLASATSASPLLAERAALEHQLTGQIETAAPKLFQRSQFGACPPKKEGLLSSRRASTVRANLPSLQLAEFAQNYSFVEEANRRKNCRDFFLSSLAERRFPCPQVDGEITYFFHIWSIGELIF
ncbi:hypothetical protein H5407_17305 [Mitsuaria sp. WAJ17]|uniref:hypothetical protein n=1 Tax=Mitsuaria sp. WAJ17 TaxID=2761452 RepID=UPI001600EDAD|nr:hypothetical protein [Mitsuaria sp. WAJ17]MBB2486989.1 hypothetical protein [Mitsuaria sp. WAJ17]